MPTKSDAGEIDDVEPVADSTASQARRVVAAYATDASNFRQPPIGVVVPASIEDVVRFSEARYRSRDANDLLAMLWTWQHADISANPRFNGDLPAARSLAQLREFLKANRRDLLKALGRDH